MKTKTDLRPWGSFRQFTQNEPTTIKLIQLIQGGKLSLQYHNHRSEFWLILSGNPVVTIGEQTIKADPNKEFFIAPKIQHRIEAPEGDVQILEIAFGDFDENDIVRLEDIYGRTSVAK